MGKPPHKIWHQRGSDYRACGEAPLVHHRFNEQDDFWLPPGGKLEGDESIFDCARRETFEETGLTVTFDRILYIQEFFEPGYHFCKFFISLVVDWLGAYRDHNI